MEIKRSRSKPDHGVVRSVIEVVNQNREVVMSMKTVDLLRSREKAGESAAIALLPGGTTRWCSSENFGSRLAGPPPSS